MLNPIGMKLPGLFVLQTQDDMIEAARSVASDGQKIAKFVTMIAKHCTDTK